MKERQVVTPVTGLHFHQLLGCWGQMRNRSVSHLKIETDVFLMKDLT